MSAVIKGTGDLDGLPIEGTVLAPFGWNEASSGVPLKICGRVDVVFADCAEPKV